MAGKMHEGEVEVDDTLVRRLLHVQFPQWADLPLERFHHSGTDNAIYRLGEHLTIRLPRIGWAAGQPEREHRWLPALAPHLPLAIPVPLGLGQPGEGYPWRWSICPWLEGATARVKNLAGIVQAARDLAAFIAGLHQIDATGGPISGPENSGRGVPLAERDAGTRAAIASLHGVIDTRAVSAAWDASLTAAAWPGPPAWVHGDLEPVNMLAYRGRFSAVIDWGCLGVGDPACDLLSAWSLFAGESRAAFRTALGVDDATWGRGRGWALSTALIALPYYMDTNPDIVARSLHKIAEVLADVARTV
jgi:aminoglycoside phosphotransferase (APT) family kinase protein